MPTHPSTSRRASRRAFSLAEIVVVMAIVTIVSGFGVLRYSAALQKYRVEMAARKLVADLTLAQTRARTTSQQRRVVFSVGGNSYTLTGEASLDNPALDFTVSLAAEPYLCRLESIAIDDTSKTLYFNGYGAPTCGGKFLISCGDLQRLIIVEAITGRTSVQTP